VKSSAPTKDAEFGRSHRGGKQGERALKEAPARSGARPDLKGVPILVVDDDAPSAKLLAVVLRSEGCDVKVASSAEEAVLVLRAFSPKVIVLDLILPLMSGLLFAERLKADPATAGIVLIAVTALNGAGAERIAYEAGFVKYVRKPVDPLSFAELVADQLRGVA
jgi:CheY-like chemotaxis protein